MVHRPVHHPSLHRHPIHPSHPILPRVHKHSIHPPVAFRADSKPRSDWDTILPIASRLIDSYATFYNRSTDLAAATKWLQLMAQGYRPVRRSKLDHRWWDEERKRGRVQADHEPSYPLSSTHPPTYPPITPPKPSSSSSPPPPPSIPSTIRRLHTTPSASPTRTKSHPTLPFDLWTPPAIVHKNSPDLIHIIGDAVNFTLPDLEYNPLESDPDPAAVSLRRHSDLSPGTKGIRGLKPGSFLELRSPQPILLAQGQSIRGRNLGSNPR